MKCSINLKEPEELRLWVGVHYSSYHKDEAYYPRFFDEQGRLLLNIGESKELERQQADQERREKERLVAKLRELGLDPNAI